MPHGEKPLEFFSPIKSAQAKPPAVLPGIVPFREPKRYKKKATRTNSDQSNGLHSGAGIFEEEQEDIFAVPSYSSLLVPANAGEDLEQNGAALKEMPIFEALDIANWTTRKLFTLALVIAGSAFYPKKSYLYGLKFGLHDKYNPREDDVTAGIALATGTTLLNTLVNFGAVEAAVFGIVLNPEIPVSKRIRVGAFGIVTTLPILVIELVGALDGEWYDQALSGVIFLGTIPVQMLGIVAIEHYLQKFMDLRTRTSSNPQDYPKANAIMLAESFRAQLSSGISGMVNAAKIPDYIHRTAQELLVDITQYAKTGNPTLPDKICNGISGLIGFCGGVVGFVGTLGYVKSTFDGMIQLQVLGLVDQATREIIKAGIAWKDPAFEEAFSLLRYLSPTAQVTVGITSSLVTLISNLPMTVLSILFGYEAFEAVSATVTDIFRYLGRSVYNRNFERPQLPPGLIVGGIPAWIAIGVTIGLGYFSYGTANQLVTKSFEALVSLVTLTVLQQFTKYGVGLFNAMGSKSTALQIAHLIRYAAVQAARQGLDFYYFLTEVEAGYKDQFTSEELGKRMARELTAEEIGQITGLDVSVAAGLKRAAEQLKDNDNTQELNGRAKKQSSPQRGISRFFSCCRGKNAEKRYQILGDEDENNAIELEEQHLLDSQSVNGVNGVDEIRPKAATMGCTIL